MTASASRKAVDSTPIFFNEFLKLTLPPIDSLNPDVVASTPGIAHANQSSALGPAYTSTPISEPEPLTAWPEEVRLWSDFQKNVQEALESLSDNEGFQHILAPCAFRKGDLPQATLLPSVHLWVIINVWQPMNRVLEMEEEKAVGGYDAKGHLRSSLFVGDHLPQVAASIEFPIPRQVVFRAAEPPQQSIAALVLVREPWLMDLTTLFSKSSGDAGSAQVVLPPKPDSTALAAALAEILAYMRTAKKRYAVLTTYTHFVFIRNAGAGSGAFGPIEISEPVSATDTDVTVYAALWYWLRLVAAEK
ncbi:hypothetical protein OC846_002388 [Tilletia horrida]|uniref:Uncharacterized protein n=1 Tax=Tilletia horrida TaxID=155126 RepID=A0AAN6GS52_9BASI|nr:hypothetical protein OC845_002599 [Tilletia horrida]KAK0553730.1 hypothetical protein OC846_002388 [Tilletia horrida]KAK0567644.1 hypothetical protein OC861_002599 [Tilletia horrida]